MRRSDPTEQSPENSDLMPVLEALRRVPHGIAVFDPSDKIIFASDTYRETYPDAFRGVPQGALIDGPSLTDILVNSVLPSVAPEDRATLEALEMRAHSKGEGLLGDYKSRRGWRRRFKYRLSSGHTVALGFPIDSLMQEKARLEMARAELQHQAMHDPLTGLPNRRGLNAHLRERLSKTVSDEETLAILHVDLDKFKAVNDTFGHHAGDKVLTIAANILRDSVRAHDVVARVGGDEFILLCEGFRSESDIAVVAQRIVDKMDEPIAYSDDYCQIGASIGIAVAKPGAHIPQMIQDADVALYKAKESGRRQYAFFTPALRANYSAKQARVGAVTDAFHLNAFEPFLQPVVDGATGRVESLRVCPRWNHIEWGPVGPERFVSEIREANLMRDLNQRMLERVIKQYRVWQSDGWTSPRIDLTFDPHLLLDEDMPLSLLDLLRNARVPHDAIGIGIGEADILEDQRKLLSEVLAGLRKAGITTFLDSFGTGGIAIPVLKTLPVDRITLARGFWQDMGDDETSGAILAAITAFARDHGMDVEAEGVGSEGERSRMISIGANALRGPAIGRPVEAKAIPAWIDIYHESLAVHLPKAEAS